MTMTKARPIVREIYDNANIAFADGLTVQTVGPMTHLVFDAVRLCPQEGRATREVQVRVVIPSDLIRSMAAQMMRGDTQLHEVVEKWATAH